MKWFYYLMAVVSLGFAIYMLIQDKSPVSLLLLYIVLSNRARIIDLEEKCDSETY